MELMKFVKQVGLLGENWILPAGKLGSGSRRFQSRNCARFWQRLGGFLEPPDPAFFPIKADLFGQIERRAVQSDWSGSE
jgi:hypothetical protein